MREREGGGEREGGRERERGMEGEGERCVIHSWCVHETWYFVVTTVDTTFAYKTDIFDSLTVR